MTFRHLRTSTLNWVTNPNDRYIGKSLEIYGEWSYGEIEMLCSQLATDATVIEVGANIGAHTVPLARHVAVGQILSFEPQRLSFQMLCANVINNDCTNVRTYNMAVGAAQGHIQVPDVDPTRHFNFGGVGLGAPKESPQLDTVPLTALDDVCSGLPRIDLIKCDAEGMETDVICGAEQIISSHRPLLYLEDDRADRSADLFDAVKALDYRVLWHAVPLFREHNMAGTKIDVFPGVHSFSILCVPNERTEITPPGLKQIESMEQHPLLRQQA